MKRICAVLVLLAIIISMFAVTPVEAVNASGSCGDNVRWNLDSSGTMRISGIGPMQNLTSTDSVPWYSLRNLIRKVIVEEGVTSIGDCAFSACINLASITLPDSLTYIGYSAFMGAIFPECKIPDGVTHIGRHAFWNCSELTSLIVPDKVTVIEQNTFNYCDKLTTILLPAGLKEIAWRAFDYCPKLTTFHYKGTRSQWEQIAIESTNTYLISAPKHYEVAFADNCINTGLYCSQCRKFLTSEKETAGQHTFVNSICTGCGAYGGGLWVLARNTAVNLRLDRDMYVDLAGFQLTGTICTNGYRIFGVDRTTDTYNCKKIGSFSCVEADGSPVVPQRYYNTEEGKHYIAIAHDGGYSFHRFQAAITGSELCPEVNGIKLNAVFYGDEMVLDQLDDSHALIFRLQLEGNSAVFVPCKRSKIRSGQEISLQIRNYDVENYGETLLSALVRVKLIDGITVNSKILRQSFRQLAESVNADPTAYDATQLAEIKEMLARYEVVKGWNVPDLTNQ
ncbi:MAG: leucine-rich repeat domain-containing protein [Oscillospiraceae bacterium]|nr:leucine-rich repeat domain-containing protein [Oscillospiraceae bacterium]